MEIDGYKRGRATPEVAGYCPMWPNMHLSLLMSIIAIDIPNCVEELQQ